MITLTVDCQTETPLLSGGADPAHILELRAPGVKGALRFWWRAFHNATGNRQLYEHESRLFGGRIQGPNNTWQSLRSVFRLDVLYSRRHMPLFRPGEDPQWGDGIRYFLFPILRNPNIAQRHQGGRPALREGFRFRLRFTLANTPGMPSHLGDLLRSLWLLAYLGGLGGRSRRGAGSFRILSFNPSIDSLISFYKLKDVPPFFYQNRYPSVGHFVSAGLTAVRTAWGMPPTSPPTTLPLPHYTAFRPGQSLVWVFSEPREGNHAGAMKAMDALGLRMKAFRQVHPLSEAQAMHTAHHSNPPAPPALTCHEKAQMGLPIIYNFRGRGRFNAGGAPTEFGAYTAQGIVYNPVTGHADRNHPDNATRRASPLFLSCHALPDGTGYAVVSYLPAPLLPAGQHVWLKHHQDPAREGFPAPPRTANYLLDLVQRGHGTGTTRRSPLAEGFNRRQRVA